MKRKVTIKKTDGMNPTRQGLGKSFNLRAPIQIKVSKKSKMSVQVGLSFDMPVHVFGTKSVAAQGVRLVDGVWAMHDAGQDIVLHLENDTDHDVVFSEGETLARCIVLDNSDVEETITR